MSKKIEYLEKIYELAEDEISSDFIPRNKNISKNEKKEIAKRFAASAIKDCAGIDCNKCPLRNIKTGDCLNSVIVAKILERANGKYIKNMECQINIFSWKKAGEFYLKHYCVEYKQEEFDI